MANYSIPKKSEIREISDKAYARVRDWTRHELRELQKNNGTAICIPLDNGNYLVGVKTVEKVSETEWNAYGKVFNSKTSAIFYCALMHQGKIKSADKLYDADFKCGRLQFEKAAFGHRLKEAYLQQDQLRIDVVSSRFVLTKDRLTAAKLELSKIISDAKYTIQD